MSWAHGYAALAVDAVFIFAAHFVVFFVVAVGFVGALVDADFAAYAALLVSLDQVLWKYVSFHDYLFAPIAVSIAS